MLNFNYFNGINNRIIPAARKLQRFKPPAAAKDTFELHTDSSIAVSFKGMSKPQEYDGVFDYMAASILENKQLPPEIKGKPVSASKIKDTVNRLFELDAVYDEPPCVDIKRTKFPKGASEKEKYIIKEAVDDTRKSAMNVWRRILTDNTREKYTAELKNARITSNKNILLIFNGTRPGMNYFDKVKENPVLKYVIWNSFAADLSETNRHIPPPVNPEVMRRTAEYFENLPADRFSSNAFGVHKFREKYSDELINHAVFCIFRNKNGAYSAVNIYKNSGDFVPAEKRNLMKPENEEGFWVEIPKRTHDTQHPGRNAAILEYLSSSSWCTKSRADMAVNYLRGGNLFIYLKRNEERGTWTPELGITALSDKKNGIEFLRIQGRKNDNIVPAEYKDIIMNLVQKNNIKLADKAPDMEGAFAAEQMGLRKVSDESNFELL